MPWKPGQSGNPGGKPKTKLLRQALMKMLAMNSAEFLAYQPLNMYETSAYEQVKGMIEGDGKYKEKARIFASVSAIVDGKPSTSDEEESHKANVTIVFDMPGRQLPPQPKVAQLDGETVDVEVVEHQE